MRQPGPAIASLCAALTLGLAAAQAADTTKTGAPPFKHYIGYHGPDGTQVYPNCNPPIEWDGKTGKNILWQTKLPDFGMGSPIVTGNRVFATCELGFRGAFPLLVCLDADTGRILWQREVSHLPAAVPDAAERARIEKAWHAMVLADEPVTDKVILKKFKELHLGLPSRDGILPGPDFPTPCTDGEFVYVSTGWRAHACYDLGGNLRWLKWFPRRSQVDAGGWDAWRSPLLWRDLYLVDMYDYIRALDKQTGDLRWEVQRSAIGANVRNVGREPGDAVHMSPKLCRVGDTHLLWCGGPAVVRLADGKPLKIAGWKNGGMTVAVNSESPDTIYLLGGHHHGAWENKGYCDTPPPVGLKLALDGDTVRTKLLWSTVGGAPACSEAAPMAYFGGKVYVQGHHAEGEDEEAMPKRLWKYHRTPDDREYKYTLNAIVDAVTGKVLGGLDSQGLPSPAAQATARTCHVYVIADGRIYGAGGPGNQPVRNDDEPAECRFEVYDLDGKRLAVNTLYGPRIEGEFRQMREVGTGFRNQFSYAPSLTVSGNRLFIRGYHFLYCIGEKQ